MNNGKMERMREKLLSLIAGLIILIFVLNALAVFFFYWYWTIAWFDMLMHFLGGLFIGLAALYLYFFRLPVKRPTPGVSRPRFARPLQHRMLASSFLIPLLSVLVIGLLWEVFELGLDTFVTFKVWEPLDAASDLVFDLLGGLAAVSYFRYKIISMV